MNCPNCGAAMAPTSNRGYYFCRHCSSYHFPRDVGDGVRPTAGTLDIDCPVCRTALQTAQVEAVEVAYCGTCRGFLTGTGAFGEIVRLRRAKHGPHERVVDPFDPAELQRRLFCPGCQKRMEAHPFFGGGNAVVDTCHHCKLIWLDAGELAIIERHIPQKYNPGPVTDLAGVLRPRTDYE